MKYPNNIYLGIVYDAMRISGHKSEHFFIDIKPKIPIKKTIYGPAFTTKGRKVKKNEDYEKLDMIRIDMYQKKYFNNHRLYSYILIRDKRYVISSLNNLIVLCKEASWSIMGF